MLFCFFNRAMLLLLFFVLGALYTEYSVPGYILRQLDHEFICDVPRGGDFRSLN